MKLELKTVFNTSVIVLVLGIIIYLSVWVRLSTINTPTVLDYDPFYFFRRANDILNNNLQSPKWDILTYYPPGRPTEPFLGWPYTIVFFYKILQLLNTNITLTKAAILSPLIMAALIPIPAFLLGRHLTNNIGGLAVALFSTLAPTFIGVSMAGYCDSDAPVVFWSFVSVLSVFLALSKRSLPYYIFAILANLLFVYNWGAGWLTLMMFLVFIPALVIFRIVEEIIHERKFKINLSSTLAELKPLLTPLLIIIVVASLIGYIIGLGGIIQSFMGGLAFTGLVGQFLVVNISVAELQPVNIFTRDGFFAVASRVGILPVLSTLIGLPLLVLYKIFRKEKIKYVEIYLFLWALIAFYLISRGVRFSLLFSIAAAISSGYVIGNLYTYLRNRNAVIFSTVFGLILLFSLMFVSDAIQIGLTSGGMILSQNWYDMLDWLKKNADKDSLITTWWDPGHIITGYTGLKVHADGAHCPPGVCVPYNHNIRIQDMGRVFSTSDEEEAIKILQKYMSLTPQQCQEVRQKFGSIVPQDACKPVTDMYVIASADLIGKYYWLSYFGSGGNGRNFIQLPMSNYNPTQGTIQYGNGLITIAQKNNQLVPIINIPQQGIRNAIIKNIIFYQNGQQINQSFENATNVVDGLLWVEPGFRTVIFMDPQIQNSIFTKMFFFNGQGLNHFQLVYNNPEIRVFKVKF